MHSGLPFRPPYPLWRHRGHARDALKATGRAGHTCRTTNRLLTSSRRVTEAVGSARGGSTAARPAASCGASHCGARLGAMKAAAFAIAQESRTARMNIAKVRQVLPRGPVKRPLAPELARAACHRVWCIFLRGVPSRFPVAYTCSAFTFRVACNGALTARYDTSISPLRKFASCPTARNRTQPVSTVTQRSGDPHGPGNPTGNPNANRSAHDSDRSTL